MGNTPKLPQYKLNQEYAVDVAEDDRYKQPGLTPLQVAGSAVALAGIVLIAAAIFTNCAVQGTISTCHE